MFRAQFGSGDWVVQAVTTASYAATAVGGGGVPRWGPMLGPGAMRAVVQRVSESSVTVGSETVGRIGAGLLVYLGVGKEDGDNDVQRVIEKLATLRVFEDDMGKLARSVMDVGAALLVVSQFTLYGDLWKGRRPSFDDAAAPEVAEPLYRAVCDGLRQRGLRVETGRFRAMMSVHAVVDGPITLLVDTNKRF